MNKTILLSGRSGMIGGPLAERMEQSGYSVLSLVRRDPKGESDLLWDPVSERPPVLPEGVELAAVVHLAGEPVGAGRWSEAVKKRIADSRVKSTRALATLAAERGARAFISASGVGYYGVEASQPVDESGPRGEGFLAEVVQEWEDAASPARSAGVRTVAMRLGVVLDRSGGALAKMLPVFRMGMGGPIGGGDQWMSFLSLLDAQRAFMHALATPELEGPVNVCTDNAVTNKDFTKALGKALGRPAFMPVPRLAIMAAFGEMGRETVLASQRAVPKRLLATGFSFSHPNVESALAAALA
jgi:uncharacterized protein (TIGR01777 family)